MSRSGAFVFYLGERYFGTVVAYVAGPEAARYKFTSALTTQVLKVLAPTLMHHLDLGGPGAAWAAAKCPRPRSRRRRSRSISPAAVGRARPPRVRLPAARAAAPGR